MLQSKDQQLRKIEEEIGRLHEEDSFAMKMVDKASSEAQANIVKDVAKSLNPEQKRELVTSTVQEASSKAQANIVKDAVKSLDPEQKREIVTSTVQEASSNAQVDIVKDAVKSLNPEKQEEVVNKLLPDLRIINKIRLYVFISLSLAILISVSCLASSILLNKTNAN